MESINKSSCFGRGRGRRPIVETIHVSKSLLEITKENELLELQNRVGIHQQEQPAYEPKSNEVKSRTAVWKEKESTADKGLHGLKDPTKNPADVRSFPEEICGSNEPYSIPFAKPILPTQIIHKNGRYYTLTSGPVRLPEGVGLNTRLLYIDNEDVLYLRYYEEDQSQSNDDPAIGTLQKLLACMGTYYSKLPSREEIYCRIDGWTPFVGEVVVARATRISDVDHLGMNRTEYHRAVVKAWENDYVIVQLIDDYGVGGIPFSDIFKILPQFTELPGQVFHCELAKMGLVSHRKIVHSIVRDCVMPNIWSDCHLNVVRTTWLGGESVDGRPFVEIMIQQKSNQDNYNSLKYHVYQNLQSVLTPFVHLVTDMGYCHIFGADQLGYLWVRFVADNELYCRMRFVLDKLVPYYINLLQYCRLTVKMLAPQDDLPRLKRNMKKLYVVLLHDPEKINIRCSKKLYRVIVKKVNPRTQKANVYCIDDHIFEEVDVCALFPLYNLNPDLSYISPLIFKVHLHGLKTLKTTAEQVKDTLYGEDIKMTLVHEWPGHVYPPDVNIDNPFKTCAMPQPADNEMIGVGMEINVTGYSKYFMDNGCAEKLERDEMTLLWKMVKNQVARHEEKRILPSDREKTSPESEMKTQLVEQLTCRTFIGKNYCFVGDKFCRP